MLIQLKQQIQAGLKIKLKFCGTKIVMSKQVCKFAMFFPH